MTIEGVIRQIWPGATLYVLLLTFAIAAFRYARELRAGEIRIYQEFLDRVRSIRDIFQRRYLEPVVARVIDDSAEGASAGAVQVVRTAFQEATAYPLDRGAVTVLLDQCMTALAARTAPGQAFLTSQDGSAFMEQLDRRQQQRQRMTASYDAVKRHTRNGYFSFLTLSVLLLLGLLSLLAPVPTYVVTTYIDVTSLVLLFGVYSVVRMFRAETALRDTFEQLALYTEEFE